MKRSIMISAALAATLCTAATAQADDNGTLERFHARLSGFNEVGPLPGPTAAETGAILSGGSATADVELDKAGGSATYTLNISGTFSSAITQSHIHFGKNHVPGGIMVFFCSNLGNGPAGTPACPQSGTVTGSWSAGSVVGPAAQNLPAGDFDGLVAALESNSAYANLHTAKFPAGEIRDQMHHADRDD